MSKKIYNFRRQLFPKIIKLNEKIIPINYRNKKIEKGPKKFICSVKIKLLLFKLEQRTNRSYYIYKNN
ncbi:hypothetical protein BpHYR1_051160 [Brachionus plicatilis]|uniref:Uncharacterized protein n=1 Tax=Brachionus plicatilis TaxID=10195 RepID=A0A3M7PTL2_BRAPC|nr:hypothetical protein BpHYR1_051160 [Brachionus plicatilis]